MGKVMVVAGEVSGDMHAARVVKEIKKMAPATSFVGMGSSHLREAGVNVIIDPTQINSVGFQEALANIKTHLSHLRLLEEKIEQEKPDVLFLVDYSGFNMFMARKAARKNIPAVNYFPPTAWIWGKWRARWMARTGVKIAAVLPMERNVYLNAGARVDFVGHPLLDMINIEDEKSEIYEKLEVDPSRPLIGVLPGSRPSEIKSLLPEMLEALEKLQQEHEELQLVLPVASGIDQKQLRQQCSEYGLIIKIVKDYTHEVMSVADFLITASGTATLEASILQTPSIIIYKTSWLSYQLGKRLIKVNNIGMPNIIAHNQILPELLQDEASAENIYEQARSFLKKPYLLNSIEKKLKRVKNMLGEEGATARTAELVLQEGALTKSE